MFAGHMLSVRSDLVVLLRSSILMMLPCKTRSCLIILWSTCMCHCNKPGICDNAGVLAGASKASSSLLAMLKTSRACAALPRLPLTPSRSMTTQRISQTFADGMMLLAATSIVVLPASALSSGYLTCGSPDSVCPDIGQGLH